MTIEAIAAIQAGAETQPTTLPLGQALPQTAPSPGANFTDMMTGAVAQVEDKVDQANRLVRSFAIGDDVPLHQVTFALEEARLSVELMMQFRTRLVEGYREIMNMQM
ncbi:MAG: flagellar hook-basal body complex protein FliE [Pseudomonadota bacterium]